MAFATRRDPYKNFRFRVYIPGFDVAGFTRVSGLHQSTEVLPYREGGDNTVTRKLMGQTDFAPIILERGMSEDVDFYYWASAVFNIMADVVPEELVKNIVTIQLLDKVWRPVKTWAAYNCWPSEYQSDDMNSMSSAVMIERLSLANEGIVQIP